MEGLKAGVAGVELVPPDSPAEQGRPGPRPKCLGAAAVVGHIPARHAEARAGAVVMHTPTRRVESRAGAVVMHSPIRHVEARATGLCRTECSAGCVHSPDMECDRTVKSGYCSLGAPELLRRWDILAVGHDVGWALAARRAAARDAGGTSDRGGDTAGNEVGMRTGGVGGADMPVCGPGDTVAEVEGRIAGSGRRERKSSCSGRS